MPWCSKFLSAIFKVTETPGGTPVILELDTPVLLCFFLIGDFLVGNPPPDILFF